MTPRPLRKHRSAIRQAMTESVADILGSRTRRRIEDVRQNADLDRWYLLVQHFIDHPPETDRKPPK